MHKSRPKEVLSKIYALLCIFRTCFVLWQHWISSGWKCGLCGDSCLEDWNRSVQSSFCHGAFQKNRTSVSRRWVSHKNVTHIDLEYVNMKMGYLAFTLIYLQCIYGAEKLSERHQTWIYGVENMIFVSQLCVTRTAWLSSLTFWWRPQNGCE